MTKKSCIRIVIGLILNTIVLVIIANNMENWRDSRWPSVITGAIAAFIVFPPIVQWAQLTKKKHSALSRGIIIFLSIWSVMWGVISILTIMGILK